MHSAKTNCSTGVSRKFGNNSYRPLMLLIRAWLGMEQSSALREPYIEEMRAER